VESVSSTHPLVVFADPTAIPGGDEAFTHINQALPAAFDYDLPPEFFHSLLVDLGLTGLRCLRDFITFATTHRQVEIGIFADVFFGTPSRVRTDIT